MGHRSKYYLRLEIEKDNELVLINQACYKEYTLDILKYNFTRNTYYYRWGNISYTSLSGWTVEYPGELVRERYSREKYKVKEYPFQESNEVYEGLLYGELEMSYPMIKKIILKVNPEYKYLLNKISLEQECNIFTLFKLMQMWKEHPYEVELLVQKRFYSIALNKSLYKLTLKKKKEVLKALKNFNHNVSLLTVQQYIKSGLKFDEWWAFMTWNNWRVKGNYIDSLETFRYCQRKQIDKYRYRDMLDMARNQGHNIDDPYWKYPNNPNEMHDRLLQIKLEQERMQEQEEMKKVQKAWDKIQEIKNKNLKESIDLGNGYSLFIPTTIEQYRAAADKLHQCIITAKYYIKVAKGNCLLLMIWHNGEPSSTCEIDYNKQILQFYGNELDRKNCKPSEYEQEAMNKFLMEFKLKKIKNYYMEM